jgi:hypothetical protein
MKTFNDFMIFEKIEESLKLLETKSLIPRNYLKIILAVSFVLLFFGIYDELVSTLLCAALPLFWSALALYRKDVAEMNHWIIYWCAYSVIYFFEILGVKSILPFYHFIKCIGLMYLYFPNTRGTNQIHKLVSKKLQTTNHERENPLLKDIDSKMNKRTY